MQITVILSEPTTKKITELSRLIDRSPESLCLIFIEDGVQSYSTEKDIAELRETLNAEP